MKDLVAGLLMGALITVFAVRALADLSENSYKNTVDRAIRECEQTLPRNEHCTIVAVPVSRD